MGSVECSVQMFLFFLHNHKSYLLLSVCLTGRNLGRLFQDGVCTVHFFFFLTSKHTHLQHHLHGWSNYLATRANITGRQPFIEIMLQMVLITFKNIFYHYTIAYCAEAHLFSCCNVHIRDFLSASEIHCNLHSETRRERKTGVLRFKTVDNLKLILVKKILYKIYKSLSLYIYII